jgi:hypothetical protein
MPLFPAPATAFFPAPAAAFFRTRETNPAAGMQKGDAARAASPFCGIGWARGLDMRLRRPVIE